MRLTYNWIVKEKDIKQILLYYKEGKKKQIQIETFTQWIFHKIQQSYKSWKHIKSEFKKSMWNVIKMKRIRNSQKDQNDKICIELCEKTHSI